MTRAEYVSDAVVHVTGLVLVAGAVPWLILLAATKEHPPAMLGVSIYGASLALMILASALYNMILYAQVKGIGSRSRDHVQGFAGRC